MSRDAPVAAYDVRWVDLKWRPIGRQNVLDGCPRALDSGVWAPWLPSPQAETGLSLHNRAMPFDSSDSRRAAEFDSFRRELVLNSKTVAGERREEWFQRLKELVGAMFPENESHARKPGLATRMFSIEVSLPRSDKMHLLDLAQELDDNWQAMCKGEVKAGASCVYLDRLDAVWEWALNLGPDYVTGHVKLRSFGFDKPGDGERRGRSEGQGKPDRPYRDKPDRPRRPRPSEDRPTYGKSRGPSDGPPPSSRPYRSPKPGDRPYGGGGKGRRPSGPTKKGPYRPKRKGSGE